jgi:hypothetical protein
MDPNDLLQSAEPITMEEVQAATDAALEADRLKSLRDAFAGGALSAIIASEGPGLKVAEQLEQCYTAYEYADMMMKARGQ